MKELISTVIFSKLLFEAFVAFFRDMIVRTQKFQQTNVLHPLLRAGMSAQQGERNVNFSEYFTYVLNGQSPIEV